MGLIPCTWSLRTPYSRCVSSSSSGFPLNGLTMPSSSSADFMSSTLWILRSYQNRSAGPRSAAIRLSSPRSAGAMLRLTVVYMDLCGSNMRCPTWR